jgi:hypothetical protein
MKKALTGLLAMLGLANAPADQQKVQMVDPNTIMASISTISDDAAPVEPAGKIEPGDLVFHEDDWRQIEFFPASREAEIRKTLAELAMFEKAHRKGAVWDKIYLRKLDVAPVLPGPLARDTLLADLGQSARPAPVLFYGDNVIVGRVAHGFSVPVGKSVALYGFQDSTGIPVLGASVQPGSDDLALTRVFAKLNASHHLIMVDWRQHLLLLGVAPGGNFEAWRP